MGTDCGLLTFEPQNPPLVNISDPSTPAIIRSSASKLSLTSIITLNVEVLAFATIEFSLGWDRE